MNAHGFHYGMLHGFSNTGRMYRLECWTENTNTAQTWLIFFFSTFNSGEYALLSFCRCSYSVPTAVLNYKYEWTVIYWTQIFKNGLDSKYLGTDQHNFGYPAYTEADFPPSSHWKQVDWNLKSEDGYTHHFSYRKPDFVPNKAATLFSVPFFT